MPILGKKPKYFEELCGICHHPDYFHRRSRCDCHPKGPGPDCHCSGFESPALKLLAILSPQDKFKVAVYFYILEHPEMVRNPSLYVKTNGSGGVLNLPVILEIDAKHSAESWVESNLPKESSARLQHYLVEHHGLKLKVPYWKR